MRTTSGKRQHMIPEKVSVNDLKKQIMKVIF